jgi:hypothetical protein
MMYLSPTAQLLCIWNPPSPPKQRHARLPFSSPAHRTWKTSTQVPIRRRHPFGSSLHIRWSGWTKRHGRLLPHPQHLRHRPRLGDAAARGVGRIPVTDLAAALGAALGDGQAAHAVRIQFMDQRQPGAPSAL